MHFKTAILLLGLILLTSVTSIKNSNEVYICDSEGATKYHLIKNCRGLSHCKHDIIKVTIQQAYNKGKKTLCGWED